MSMHFFFFKQKTAYEMRISDWSSDVCSSDLVAPEDFAVALEVVAAVGGEEEGAALPVEAGDSVPRQARLVVVHEVQVVVEEQQRRHRPRLDDDRALADLGACPVLERSEEHTSELQSLMRSSYAVFCLKKKTNIKYIHTSNNLVIILI